MVGEALFLLGDIQFLDVVDKFLLKAVLVVVDFWNLLKAVNDTLTDFLHTRVLVWFNALHESLDIVDFLAEFLCESLTFLTTEINEGIESRVDSLTSNRPFLFGKDFCLILLYENVRHTQDDRHHLGHRRSSLVVAAGKCCELLVVILSEFDIDRCCISHLVLFNPDREIHFSADNFLLNHLSHLHFFLTIEWGNAS